MGRVFAAGRPAPGGYDVPMPEFDAPHGQPEHPPPEEHQTARRLTIAFLVTIAVSAAALAVMGWLVWVAFNR